MSCIAAFVLCKGSIRLSRDFSKLQALLGPARLYMDLRISPKLFPLVITIPYISFAMFGFALDDRQRSQHTLHHKTILKRREVL